MLNIFKKKSISRESKEMKKALRLVRRVTRMRAAQLLFIIFAGLVLAPFVVFYFYRPRVQQNLNYGITFSKRYASELGLDWKQTYIDILDDLGAKNLRLVSYWDEVENDRDNYNFNDVIWQVEEAEKRDLSVIMAIGRKVPRYPECFEPEWWKLIEDEETKKLELLEYEKIAVNTLKKYKAIKIWQVENEPFFKFGDCVPPIKNAWVQKEVGLVRSLDERPIIIQDSGEGGFWYPAYRLGDYLGISMYRKIWYDFWHIFLGNFIYFKYPLAHWSYKIKAEMTLVPHENIMVTELQAEPWGPGINSILTEEEKNKTMSRHDFLDTISYAQKSGFRDLYFWGVEWWYWEKYNNGNSFYWDTAKALFN